MRIGLNDIMAGGPALSALLMLAGAAPAGARADWPPPSYQAVYEIYADGKLSGETRVSFTLEADTWSFVSSTRGVKGLARFLGVTSDDTASGGWRGHEALPEVFDHQAKVAFKDDAWKARFDWTAGTVQTWHKEGESVLELEPGTVDPVTLTLALQSRLDQGETAWSLGIVDEEKIDQHAYQALAPAPLQTGLGCMQAVEVKRIRENSKRYSSFWAASGLHFVPVRMLHGKTGGHELDSRLRELTIDGQPVAATADCPADP